MRIQILQGDEIISEPIPTDDVMVRPTSRPKKATRLVVAIDRPNTELQIVNDADRIERECKDTVNTIGIVIEGPKTDSNTSYINDIIKESNTWTPDTDCENSIEEPSNNIEEAIEEVATNEEDVATPEGVKEEDIISDSSNKTGMNREPIRDEDDEPDMVFASDINLQRPKPRRNEKGQFMPSEDGPKKGKKKKKDRDGTKSTFIPRSN